MWWPRVAVFSWVAAGLFPRVIMAVPIEGMAFPGTGELPQLPNTYVFPEQLIGTFTNWATGTENVGVAFSGGGSRAFATALGQIAMLRDKNMWRNIRYSTGTSGGSWALGAYSYRNGISADDFLPKYTSPHHLTLDKLSNIAQDCALAYPLDFSLKDYESVTGDAWVHAIWKTFLQPAGILEDALLGWQRNASLPYKDVDDPRPVAYVADPIIDPFPLFGFSIWGPTAATPFSSQPSPPPRASFPLRVLEASPVAIGTALLTPTTYYGKDGRRRSSSDPPVELEVGGFLSPDLFSCEGLFSIGSSLAGSNDTECEGGRVALAVGASSFFSGGGFAIELGPLGNTAFGLKRTYYAGGVETPQFLLADGGCVENVYLSGLLQRGVERIVLFFNAEVPLNVSWDSFSRNATTKDLNDDLPAFFEGRLPEESLHADGYDYRADAVFPYDDFPVVISKIQASISAGNGGVATTTHTTIENDNLGVPPGVRVKVTWCYLSDSSKWRSLLPLETKAFLDSDPLFDKFPHFSTLDVSLTTRQLNALAALAAWVVDTNDDFDDLVDGATMP